jgi:xanthine dehydrogenase accessory protein XdhC
MHAAKRMLAGGAAQDELELTLGPSLRQCCGGRVRLALERVAAPVAEDAPADAPDVMIFGAGHVGRAILHVLQPLPWRITLVDPRAHHLPEPTPNFQPVRTDDLVAKVANGPPQALWIVATHSHDLDLDVVDAVLRRGDFRWLGLIGSATKRATFERRLVARGHMPAALAKLACPMGIASIRDKHPAAIAVSVAAEMLSLLSQGEGSA